MINKPISLLRPDSKLDQMWLIYSLKHGSWWKGDRAGYTRDEKEAGRYTLYEAEILVNNSNIYLPKDDGVYNSLIVPSPEFIEIEKEVVGVLQDVRPLIDEIIKNEGMIREE